MAVSYEALDAARHVASIIGEAASLPGWTDHEYETLAICSKALWDARDVLLRDHDHPEARRRRAFGTPAATAAGPTMTVNEAARALGVSQQSLRKRMARRGVSGTKQGRELRLTAEDVAALAARRVT